MAAKEFMKRSWTEVNPVYIFFDGYTQLFIV